MADFLKAIGQVTIVDLTDPVISDEEPENKFKDMLWLDTSLTPPVLKYWDAYKWVVVNSDEDEVNTLKDRIVALEAEVVSINKKLAQLTTYMIEANLLEMDGEDECLDI
jgi:hypothetical protein